MRFIKTKLEGAYIVELDYQCDSRGFFARTWCREEFAALGLSGNVVQCNLSHNIKRGTVRGMHYQTSPYEEVKVVSCIAGAIYDVIVDLRKNSATYGSWQAFELSTENHRQLYVPVGFAHGFQTLRDDTTVFYQMSEYYHPECARGVKWDDPQLAISWPIDEKIISEKDQTYGRWQK